MRMPSYILRKTALVMIYCTICWLIGSISLVADRAFYIPIDEYLYSLHFPFRCHKDPRIVIISTDDGPTEINGHSSHNRIVFANMIKKLESYHPTLIAIDVLFDKSISTPGDDDLADAIRKSNNIILASYKEMNDDHFEIDELINENIRKGALGIGYSNFYLNRSGNIYTLPMSITIDKFKRARAPYVFEICKHYMRSDYRAITFNEYRLGDLKLPSVNPINRYNESFPIFYIGNLNAFTSISWNDFMYASHSIDSLRGAIVLIGSTSLNEDAHKTPMSFSKTKLVPGVVIIANALYTLLNEKFIHTMDQSFVTMSTLCAPMISLLLYYIYGKPRAMFYNCGLICLYVSLMQITFHITLVYANVTPTILSGILSTILFLFLPIGMKPRGQAGATGESAD